MEHLGTSTGTRKPPVRSSTSAEARIGRMTGSTSTPASGKGRRVYYVRMGLSHMIHPEKALLLLTTDDLGKAIPEFNWEEGHSGVILGDAMAKQLDALWHDYVEKEQQMAKDDKDPYFLGMQV